MIEWPSGPLLLRGLKHFVSGFSPGASWNSVSDWQVSDAVATSAGPGGLCCRLSLRPTAQLGAGAWFQAWCGVSSSCRGLFYVGRADSGMTGGAAARRLLLYAPDCCHRLRSVQELGA